MSLGSIGEVALTSSFSHVKVKDERLKSLGKC